MIGRVFQAMVSSCQKSKKQQTVALSTCEAEYIALAETVQEGKFFKQLCVDLGILQVSNSILINADNQGAIKLAKNAAFHKRSKHIDVKFYFIKSAARYSKPKLCRKRR